MDGDLFAFIMLCLGMFICFGWHGLGILFLVIAFLYFVG